MGNFLSEGGPFLFSKKKKNRIKKVSFYPHLFLITQEPKHLRLSEDWTLFKSIDAIKQIANEKLVSKISNFDQSENARSKNVTRGVITANC